MMKQFYFILGIFMLIAQLIRAQAFEEMNREFPTTYKHNGQLFVQDSTYTYNSSDKVSAYGYNTFDIQGYESNSHTISTNWEGNKENLAKDEHFYDKNYRLIKYNLLSWSNNRWVKDRNDEYFWSNDRKDSSYIKRYDKDLEEWFLASKEINTYDKATGAQTSFTRYSRNSLYENMIPDTRFEYSQFNRHGKPEKGILFTYTDKWQKYMSIYFEYDEKGRLANFVYKFINEDGTENSIRKEERKYNDLNQITEEISYSQNYMTNELDFDRKTEYTYDIANHYLTQATSYWYNSGDTKWVLSGKLIYFWSKFEPTPIQPLARIGSHWNYWVAQEYSFGYIQYKALKDTTITAPVYETGKMLTAKASWIEKYSNLTAHGPGAGVEDVYLGAFAAIRIKNTSYVYDLRAKSWFKWIDMDAKPGDKWITTELITGKGMYDYVEVSFTDTLEVDGTKRPYIYLMPSCTSRFTADYDFTSRISMTGHYNIDFWSLRKEPEPKANGIVYTQTLREINSGLLCADVNGESLNTELLAEYVEFNNKPYFDKGIIDCDSLRAPIRQSSGPGVPAKAPLRPELQQNQVEYNLFTPKEGISFAGKEKPAVKQHTMNTPIPEGIIEIPVVVHIVHNPDTPKEKISTTQVNEMLEAINEAFGSTAGERVRETFKDVIGNPQVNFVLADADPEGKTTGGIAYHETDEDYYSLQPSSGDIKVQYAYKFNSDGTARNWDVKKYANIYIVDLGGFGQKNNVGGFVTNPEAIDNETWELKKNWYKSGDPAFWQNWLDTEEASQLDGLTVDTWYTFGGLNAENPEATFGTAIHELGHYLGLRHVALQIIQNSDGTLEVYDDGFSDTPLTHFTQYGFVPCTQDVLQCGELVQVENYMDYCLECACMFTTQQAAYIRKFISEVRPFFAASGITETTEDNNEITVYPNPATDQITISGNFKKATIYDISGCMIERIARNTQSVSVENLKSGVYLIKFTISDSKTIVKKLIKQ